MYFNRLSTKIPLRVVILHKVPLNVSANSIVPKERSKAVIGQSMLMLTPNNTKLTAAGLLFHCYVLILLGDI